MQGGLGPKERGLTALREGDAAGAVALLTETVRLDPADADAFSGLGVALCQAGRATEGLPALQRAVELQPERAPLRFNLARALELTGRKAEAREEFRRVLAIDPRHQSAAQGVQRLGGEPEAPPPPAPAPVAPRVSEFLLPTGPVGPAPSDTAVVANLGGSQPASVVATPLPAPVPLPPNPQPVVAPPPMPYGAHPGAQAVAAPPPRPGMKPGVIVAIVCGGCVTLIAMMGVLVAVLLPAIQAARDAARRSQPGAYAGTGMPSDAFRPTPPPPTGLGATPVGTVNPALDLSREGGGPQVHDSGFGFSVTFPADFPSPQLSGGVEPMGLGGTTRRTMYQSSLEGRLASVTIYAMPPEVYDRTEQEQLCDVGRTALLAGGGQVTQRDTKQYQNYPAQDVRFTSTFGGSSRQGRGRIVLARPRVMVVAFESPEPGDLEQPAVTAFLDSLTIEEQEHTPGVHAPIQVPTSPSPGIPTTPGGPGGQFTPPPVPDPPRPSMPELPTRPDPSELEERLRSRMERFGPRRPQFTPGVPSPPGFGAPPSPGVPGSDAVPGSGAPTPGI